MDYTYTYQLTDFLNDAINFEKFKVETEASSLGICCICITVHQGQVMIDFDNELSSAEETVLDTIVANHDGLPIPNPLEDFLDENAEVEILPTDATAAIVGPFTVMQTLINRRELFNDTDNPIYDSTVTPILGENGYLVDHSNRINNLETIHGKLGWHHQEIHRATYKKPDNLLIFYGWPNSFNSAVNGWNNEKVAQEMARYDLIVLGDGIQNSGHGDYSNTSVIIPRIKALNPRAKIFGYVTINQTLSNFQTKVSEWDTLQVHGIFLDEAGYDYGSVSTNGREAFNEKVDYVHGKTYSNLCFANTWNFDHILGTTNDASYPNTSYNSNLVASNLTQNDYVLLESFAVNSASYTNDYETASNWTVRGSKACSLRETYGINVVGSCVIEDGHADTTALLNFAFTSAMMYNLEGFGSSDIYYGASSAKNTFIPRPDVSNIGNIYELSPSVQQDVSDSDVYHRYTQFGKLSLDFSTGAQTSTIQKF